MYPHLKYEVIKKTKIFCKNSTIHGLYYFHSRRHWVVHTFWAIIILCSMSLCGSLSLMIWDKFIIDPTFTVVESSRFPTANIPFPSVTVCDTEAVYGPEIGNISHILIRRGYTTAQINDFYRSITDVKDKDYVVDPTVKKMHSLMQDLGYMIDVLLNMLKKPCDILVVRCIWRSRVHNCSEMFRTVYIFAGYCCQFDMNYFKEHATRDTNFVSGVENTEALDITVNGQKVSADGTTADGYVTLFVVDEKNNVNLIDSSITLTPAGFFEVNINLWAIDSSAEVKALAIKTRKCVLDTDAIESPKYYQGCVNILILRQVVNYCRCLPFNYTSEELTLAEDYAPCTWERLSCIYQTIYKVMTSIGDIVNQNECLQRCDYVQYDTEIEYIRHQRFYRQMNESYSRVTVHFSSHYCMKYRREVLYTWDEMLANLGGIFGLCLGGSIISLIELFWYLIDLLFTPIITFAKKRINPTSRKQVFTLTQTDFSASKIGGKYKFAH